MIDRGARIFVATAPIDFRGSFDRLAGAVRAHLQLDPRSGAFFVFFNRAADRVKILFFDQTGDCILYKQLDHGTFRGVINLDAPEGRVQIDAEALRTLLAGAPRSSKPRVH
jgi:transposase